MVALCNNVINYSKHLLINLEPNYLQSFVCIFLASWDLSSDDKKKAISEGKKKVTVSPVDAGFRNLCQGPIISIYS